MHNDKVFNNLEFPEQLRPAWTPLNIAITILFFVIGAWMLGLLMIAYVIWGRQLGLDFSNWGRTKESVIETVEGVARTARRDGSSGNQAFDDWREAELSRLDEERKRLDEARREFEEYVRELRRARDRDEFNAFKTRWADRSKSGETGA